MMAEYPPGWNDPPPLSFSQYNSSAVGKRNLLNKRVPFPLNQSATSPPLDKEKHSVSSELSTSPVSSNTKTNNISSPAEHTNLSEESNITLEEEEILPFVISTFEKILSENSDNYEKKRIEEINQRLKVMKDSWDSKISLPVKHKMFSLAQELSRGNAEAALKIQCILMVDNLREVKQWMVGVKHIIEMERQKVSSLNISSASTD